VEKRVEALLSKITVEGKITLIGGINDCQRFVACPMGWAGNPESCRGRARQRQARRR
jgi:hypothetical protein